MIEIIAAQQAFAKADSGNPELQDLTSPNSFRFAKTSTSDKIPSMNLIAATTALGCLLFISSCAHNKPDETTTEDSNKPTPANKNTSSVSDPDSRTADAPSDNRSSPPEKIVPPPGGLRDPDDMAPLLE